MTPPGLNRSMRRTDESTAGGLTLRQGELLHGGELDPLCVRGAPFDGFGAVLRKIPQGVFRAVPTGNVDQGEQGE